MVSEQVTKLTQLICLQSVVDGGSWESVRPKIFKKARSFSKIWGFPHFPTAYQGVPSELEIRGDAVEDYMVGLIEQGLVSGDEKRLEITPKGRQLMIALSTEAKKKRWAKSA